MSLSNEPRFPRIQPSISFYPNRNVDSRILSAVAELSVVLSSIELLVDQQDRNQFVEVINSIDRMSHYREQVLARQSSVCHHPEDAKDPFCKNPYCSVGLLVKGHGIYTRKNEGWRYHPFFGQPEHEPRPKTLRLIREFTEELTKRIEDIKEKNVRQELPPIFTPDSKGTYRIDDPDVAILTHGTEFEQLSLTSPAHINYTVAEDELKDIYGSNTLSILSLRTPGTGRGYATPATSDAIDLITMLEKESEFLPFYVTPYSELGYRYRNRIFIRGLRYWFAILEKDITVHASMRSYEFYFENQFDFPTFVIDQNTEFKLHATSYLTLEELESVIEELSSSDWNVSRNTACEHLTFHVNTKSKRCYVTDRFGDRIGYRGLLLQYNIPKNPSGR